MNGRTSSKCRNCGRLTKVSRPGTYPEVAWDARENWIGSGPLCFSLINDLQSEFRIAREELVLELGDGPEAGDAAHNQVLDKPRDECSGFTRYRQGYGPREHDSQESAATTAVHAAPALKSPSLMVVAFTDVVGHTSLMARLGDEAGRAVMREYETRVRSLIEMYNGTVVKPLGDGFLLTFVSVTAALKFALDLENPGQSNFLGHGITTRVGINAGEPVVEDGDVFGLSVIATARVMAEGSDGGTFVSDVVRNLAMGKSFDFSEVGLRKLKGLPEPVRLWRLRDS